MSTWLRRGTGPGAPARGAGDHPGTRPGVGEAAAPLLSSQWRHTRQQPVPQPSGGKAQISHTSIADPHPAWAGRGKTTGAGGPCLLLSGWGLVTSTQSICCWPVAACALCGPQRHICLLCSSRQTLSGTGVPWLLPHTWSHIISRHHPACHRPLMGCGLCLGSALLLLRCWL